MSADDHMLTPGTVGEMTVDDLRERLRRIRDEELAAALRSLEELGDYDPPTVIGVLPNGKVEWIPVLGFSDEFARVIYDSLARFLRGRGAVGLVHVAERRGDADHSAAITATIVTPDGWVEAAALPFHRTVDGALVFGEQRITNAVHTVLWAAFVDAPSASVYDDLLGPAQPR